MNKPTAAIALVLIMFVGMSCGLIDRFTGGDKMTKVDDLWSDVPRMDGISHSDMDMPVFVKFLMRTALNNLWRFNKEGEDKTPVSGDWTVYSLSRPPSDAANFYTNERMTSFGNWDTEKASTCVDGKDKGFDGMFCVFHKIADKKEVVLSIIAVAGDSPKQTNIFYLRLENDVPADAKTSPTPNKR